MKDKNELKEELRNVLIELQNNKFNDAKKEELYKLKKEIETQYKQVLLQEKTR